MKLIQIKLHLPLQGTGKPFICFIRILKRPSDEELPFLHRLKGRCHALFYRIRIIAHLYEIFQRLDRRQRLIFHRYISDRRSKFNVPLRIRKPFQKFRGGVLGSFAGTEYSHVRSSLSHIAAPSLKGRIGPHPAFDGILVLPIHDHLFRKVSGAGRRTDVGQQTAALQPILIIHTALIPAVYMRDVIGIPRLSRGLPGIDK